VSYGSRIKLTASWYNTNNDEQFIGEDDDDNVDYIRNGCISLCIKPHSKRYNMIKKHIRNDTT